MVAIGAAAFVSWSETPTYRSAPRSGSVRGVFTPGTAPQAPDMGTEKAVATSDAVLLRASRLIGVPVAQLSHGLSVSVPLNTNTLRIAYSSTDPARAQRRAQAVADAYTAYWLAEQPSPRTKPADGGRRPLSAAVSSQTPRGPRRPAVRITWWDLIVATVIGLMVAAGTAFVRDRLDDRLRAPNEMEEFGAGPVLAVISAGPAPARRRPQTGS